MNTCYYCEQFGPAGYCKRCGRGLCEPEMGTLGSALLLYKGEPKGGIWGAASSALYCKGCVQ